MFPKKQIRSLCQARRRQNLGLAAALPAPMGAADLWQPIDLPPGLPHAIAPISLFGIHEKFFIQVANGLNGLSARQQAGSADPIRADRQVSLRGSVAWEIRPQQPMRQTSNDKPLSDQPRKIIAGRLKAPISVDQG